MMYEKKQIWNISYPIFLSLLAQNIINVTDTAFLGRVGEVELGASAMGGLYYICAFTIAFGFSTGSQIVIGRRNGERNFSAVGPVVIQGTFFLLVLALALFLLSRLWTDNLMHLMISSEEIWGATMKYLDWRLFGFFFSFVNVMFRAFFVGVTRTKVLTLSAVVMAFVNVLLDYLLIFGRVGLPKMGIEGAAIASVMAEAVTLVFFLTYTYFTVDRRKYGLNRFRSFDMKLLAQVLKVSVFTMLQYFVSMSTYFLFFIVVERLGQRELAIANIVRSIYIVMLIPVNALSTTTNTMVSNLMGAGKAPKVIPLIRHIAWISLVIMLVFSTVLSLFPQAILAIYTNETALLLASVPSIYVIALAVLFCSVASIFFSGVSGTGNTRSAFMLEMVVLVAYTLFIYVFGIKLHLPVHLCFIAEIVYFAGLLLASLAYLRWSAWDKKKI